MKIPDQIKTKRLMLRPYIEDDFHFFFKFLEDPRVTRFLRFTEKQKTRQGARNFFDGVLLSYAGSQPIFALSIVHRKENIYIGTCGLTPLSDGTGFECYYVLIPDYWGRGFAVEAMSGLCQYAFSEFRIDRIVALVHPENHASKRVAEQMGMSDDSQVFDRETGIFVNQYIIRKNDRLAS